MKFFIKCSLGDLRVFLYLVHFFAHMCSYRSILSYFCCGMFLVWNIFCAMHHLSQLPGHYYVNLCLNINSFEILVTEHFSTYICFKLCAYMPRPFLALLRQCLTIKFWECYYVSDASIGFCFCTSIFIFILCYFISLNPMSHASVSFKLIVYRFNDNN